MYTFGCNIIVRLFWICSMVFPNCSSSNCRILHIKGSLKSENSHPWWPNSLLKLCQLSRQSLCKAVLGVTCFVVLKSGKEISDGSMDPGGTSSVGVSLKKLRLLDFKIRSYFESKRLP